MVNEISNPQSQETSFRIETNIPIPSLPNVEDKTKFNFRYPLIYPYAFAHIFWDNDNNELVYFVEEPELDDNEKRILDAIEKGIEEIINISFLNVKSSEAVTKYLEKNIRVLLSEIGISVDNKTFTKLMYYVYRDFVGFNEIEPLMKDLFIEDIECNGINTPVYIVHRKYRNLRTNLIYNDMDKLSSFVEKLAQKCGKYISYANPILDGRLPDKSRANATFSPEISTRGPTYTIRKFTSEPFSPIKLMQMRTLSPEILAYLWLLIEHESNFVVIGGTGSGKCVTGDTKIYMSNGRIVKIKDLVEKKFSENKKTVITTNDGWEYLNSNVKILTLDKENLKIREGIAGKLWRHKAPEKLVRVITRSGRSIVTTQEHPFFTTTNLKLKNVRADELKKGDRIGVPRHLNIASNNINKIKLIEYISNEKDIYIVDKNSEIKNILKILTKSYSLSNRRDLAKKLGLNYGALRFWAYKNAIPINTYTCLKKLANSKISEDIKLKSKTAKDYIVLPDITPDLFKFVAMVIGDGHLAKTNVGFFNNNKILLNEFLVLGKKIFNIEGKIKYPKNRVSKAVIYSSVISKILNKVFNIPCGNKARSVIVPNILYEQNEKSIVSFLQGIVDCESYVGKTDIEISTVSENLANEMCALFLRVGVLPRLVNRRDHYRIYISGFNNIKLFFKKVGYTHPKKIESVKKLLRRKLSRIISNVDLVPNASEFLKSFRSHIGLTQKDLAKCIDVSRRLIGMWESGFREPSIITFSKLGNMVKTIGDFDLDPYFNKVELFSESDIFWDEIDKVEILGNHNEEYVYDLTVDDTSNFIAGNIPMIVHNTSFLNSIAFFIPPAARVVSIEDTHELNILHENWLPSVAREAIGIGEEGKFGEVDLFTLLKESFRQRPDYVIVGEIRGSEAFVLFQAAASGHPIACTMHAEDVETMLQRLQSPPINLPPTLLETIDVVCIMTQTRVKGEEVRRLKSIVEIIEIGSRGNISTNAPFVWDPRTDTFFFKTESKLFDKLVVNYGLSREYLQSEFSKRTKLLMEMFRRGITGFKEVQDVINAYYKTPEDVLRRFNIHS